MKKKYPLALKILKNYVSQIFTREIILKEIRQELTYSELDKTLEHLWSVLFMTGYLTQRGKIDRKKYKLAIPNYEIREIFAEQIQEWFLEKVRQDQVKHNRREITFLIHRYG